MQIYLIFETEEPPSTSLTEDEIRCEEHFFSTCKRLPLRQYMIRLPFTIHNPFDR